MNDQKLTAAVTRAVQTLVDDHGEARPSALVDMARPKTSPIHSAFEWNDKKAAEQYRLIRARNWIRTVRVTYEERETRLIHVPPIRQAVVSDNEMHPRGEGAYKPAVRIIEKPDEFQRALDEAVQRLHAARRAVDELKRVAEQDDSDGRSAMIAQIAHGLELLEAALDMPKH